jgi:hypothetical protein
MPKESCHNKKKIELAILVVHAKVVELVVEIIVQLVIPTRVPLRYPCIIYSNYEHHAPCCLRFKTKVQNMF